MKNMKKTRINLIVTAREKIIWKPLTEKKERSPSSSTIVARKMQRNEYKSTSQPLTKLKYSNGNL